jgi:uncharacterized YccA/Bax inhibitor family protein
MSQMSIAADHSVQQTALVSRRLHIASIVLRTIFILLMLIVTVHVSMPQSSSMFSVYAAPIDLMRVMVGFAACLWLISQLFAAPGDVHAHRTWLYLGLTALPFGLICIVGIW